MKQPDLTFRLSSFSSSLLKRPSIACFVTGSFCALCMAPYNLWFFFIVGFAVLYLSLDRAPTLKHAFFYGWVFAFGYFIFSLYWIGNALLVEGNEYQWAWPLAVCGLPFGLAFFNAFACLLIKRITNLKSLTGYFLFTLILSGFEVLRGHIFTGFPWNLYGYTWIDVLPIAQLASLESIYTLTFITIFWASLPGFLFIAPSRMSKITLLLIVFISFAGSYIWGDYRLNMPRPDTDKNVHVKIVQPNIPQHEKWARDKILINFQKILSLSYPDFKETKQPQDKTIIVWPETALGPQFIDAPFYLGKIGDMLSRYNAEAILITGALRYVKESDTYYNSIITINNKGEIGDVYDKSHLVPFGEYIPFQDRIPLKPIVQFQGFKTGNGPQEFDVLDGITYTPLICYEVIFPNQVIQKRDKEAPSPDFLVNVTNDAWYGDSPGPYQHLTQARFRAIEENTPLLRAANTGVSAIIDSRGRIRESIFLNTSDVARANFP